MGLAASLGVLAFDYLQMFQRFALPAAIAVAALAYAIARLAIPMASYRGRRLLLGRWRRFARWEFWAALAFLSADRTLDRLARTAPPFAAAAHRGQPGHLRRRTAR